MVRKILQNIILINVMAVERWNLQLVAVIGGNSRIIRMKDMEYKSGLVETDTSGSGCRVTCKGMEYTDGMMEEYIMEKERRV
jgi:hypothetical protein